jgi:uncharacterized membrane protein YciS (DUF1049 family)
MRIFCLIFLAVFAGAAALFAWQNQQETTLSFLQWHETTNLAVIIGAAYGLGMLSGWTIVGMLRRSANTVIRGIEDRQDRGPL